MDYRKALIVGAGAGLSASLARALTTRGVAVVLAARSTDKLAALAAETGATTMACDASQRDDVERMFADLDAKNATPDAVIYNASYRQRAAFLDLDPAEVEKSVRISALAGFFVAQAAVRRMLPHRHGAVIFTGASASVKGYAKSAPFAMGKFALRGLAQSMARELSSQGIHVAHVVIDGGIRSERRPPSAEQPDALIDPDAIASTYMHLLEQPRSAWSFEAELRPWVENF